MDQSDRKLITPDCEYTALRSELHQWQQARITVLGFDVALLSVVLSTGLPEKHPLVATCLLQGLLALSAGIVHYATRSVVLLGRYLKLYFEGSDGWGKRSSEAASPGVAKLRVVMAWAFVVMGLLAFLPLTIGEFKIGGSGSPGNTTGAVGNTGGMIVDILLLAAIAVFVLALLSSIVKLFKGDFGDLWQGNTGESGDKDNSEASGGEKEASEG